MLHTLHSLSRLQEQSGLILEQSHYNIFDSRTFKSDRSIEDTFDAIKESFIKEWLVHIKSFIDAIMYDQSVYKVDPAKPITLIPEEAIYLKLWGLDRNNISYFYRNKDIRLIAVSSDNDSDKNSSLSVFDSPVYDRLNKSYYSPLTIIFYKQLFTDCKDDKEVLNRILLRIVNTLAISYMDNQLMNNNGVIVNRVLATNFSDSNKDIIILPESLSISDSRFIYSYFYTLFDILTHILNDSIIETFVDYSYNISLPDIFKFNMTDEEAIIAEDKLKAMNDEEASLYALGFKQKIYNRIWDLAKQSDIHSVYTEEYIDICASILTEINSNLDMTFYESQEDSTNEQEEYEDDTESTKEE